MIEFSITVPFFLNYILKNMNNILYRNPQSINKSIQIYFGNKEFNGRMLFLFIPETEWNWVLSQIFSGFNKKPPQVPNTRSILLEI